MAASSSSSPLSCEVGRLIAPFLLMLALMLYPNIATAAEITVDGEICTLPDAITAANLDSATGGCSAGNDADTLLLTAPIYSLATGLFTNTVPIDDPYYTIEYEGLSATPSITTTIVISGSNDGAIVERSGSDSYRLFHVGGTGNLTIQNVTIRYGNSTYGGGIFNRGMLTVVDSQLIENTASYKGGGIYNHDSGTANLINVSLVANVANSEGGGFSNQGMGILVDTVFISNTARIGGGFSSYRGVNINGDREFYRGRATFTDSEFISNTAEFGGGLYAYGVFGGSEVYTELTNVHFATNVANVGGGVYLGDYTATTISNTNFISNKAISGGGIFNGGFYRALTTITNSHIISNIAEIGGGIYNLNLHYDGPLALLTITDSEIRANRATYMGGAILQSDGLVRIVRSIIANNWAGHIGSAVVHQGWTQDWAGNYSSQTLLEESCIVNNSDTAITNFGYRAIDAGNNWWGAADGPTSVGPGMGDSVGSNVIYEPFLTSPILNCALRDDRTLYLPQVGQ